MQENAARDGGVLLQNDYCSSGNPWLKKSENSGFARYFFAPSIDTSYDWRFISFGLHQECSQLRHYDVYLPDTELWALEIFDLEMERKLAALEEGQILAAERERIGRDLHDHTLQSIYAAGLLLKATRRQLHLPENAELTQRIAQAEQTL